MKVLIADVDLFAKTGGGQTFYRSIIEKNPQIEFSYFVQSESADSPRPANAFAIPFREQYNADEWLSYREMLPPRWCLSAFVRASNIAHSVAGQTFDVIDLPDYEQFGLFLRPALEYHHVSFDRIALSLHGRISTTVSLNWQTEGQIDRQLRTQEDMQFQTVDLRYGLSRDYLDEWQQVVDLESHYLCPLHFIPRPAPTRTSRSWKPPSLHFVGRGEKRKGPDIFVELAWWLPREKYDRACIIGPQSYDPAGVGSNMHLYTMSNNRLGTEQIEMLPSMTTAELNETFASRSITMLPSRYDTFNLLATESLLAGCPTAVGNGAGVCRFLKETFPDVPFVTIDVDNIYACVPSLLEILDDYDAYRDRLVDAILASHPEPASPGIEAIYGSRPTSDAAVRNELADWYERLMVYRSTRSRLQGIHPISSAAHFVRKRTSPELRRRLSFLRPGVVTAALKRVARQRLASSPWCDHLKTALALIKTDPLVGQYRQLHWASECSAGDVDAKLGLCGGMVTTHRIDRTRLWREMARLESVRGNSLVAATYRLRAMRLAGGDRFDDLPRVTAALHEHGLAREAEVADAMYRDRPDTMDRCRSILQDHLVRNKSARDVSFEFVDDRRNQPEYKVSIIVSLYNAAAELPLFLRALSLQSIAKQGQMEVILIDSGSPDQEYAVFQQVVKELNVPIVYARSAKRETIQSAWNRGIALSRAKYLSFLGVDEAILPPCLEMLAKDLDADASLDWVQSNSLVTNVNDRGHWLSDVMIYDRTDYQQPFVYLETCYLSWVGALYRRSIHDRFGMYDDTFTAAGDTEFKNRILPFIKTKTVRPTYGVFWNYPSGQTTCSPRAELEDLRAWYLHRSPAGVEYAFGNRDVSETEEMLLASLKYRKSYCQHWSTDIEYAHHLSTFIGVNSPTSPIVKYSEGVARLLKTYRELDCVSQPSSRALQKSLLHATQVAAAVAREHRQLSHGTIEPNYHLFNDNRHEQHNQVWPTAA